MILAAGADDKFADAARGICCAVRRLRSEALVVMVMTVDDDIGVAFVERLEEGVNARCRRDESSVKRRDSTRRSRAAGYHEGRSYRMADPP
jgi:hypothetical protein